MQSSQGWPQEYPAQPRARVSARFQVGRVNGIPNTQGIHGNSASLCPFLDGENKIFQMFAGDLQLQDEKDTACITWYGIFTYIYTINQTNVGK